MTPREVAIWLNKECSDAEFVETFALLYKAIYSRGIPAEYDKKVLIDNMNIDDLCYKLNTILKVHAGKEGYKCKTNY